MQDSQKKASPKGILAIISLACLLAAFFWQSNEIKTNLVKAESLNNSPDYFITDIIVKTFNSDGSLSENLNAQQASHFIQESKTLLSLPKVERFSQTGSWNAIANKGIIHDGSNDILLTENARATKSYLTSEDVTLRADEVHYLDQDQSLTSQGNAKLFSTQGETSAKKITTYINSEKVIMTGLVRGYYETSH